MYVVRGTLDSYSKSASLGGDISRSEAKHLEAEKQLTSWYIGVYFDITVTNTTSLLLSLYNAAEKHETQQMAMSANTHQTMPTNFDHLSFRPDQTSENPAPPVSLIAQVDHQVYVLLANATALVSISSGELDSVFEHHIRIIAPMTDDGGKGILQVEGLWLNHGGKLLRTEGSTLGKEYANEDARDAQNDLVGERHRIGLSDLIKGRSRTPEKVLKYDASDKMTVAEPRKKTLEILTDSPGGPSNRQNRSLDNPVAGVIGWDCHLGEMFGVDHVLVASDGACLTKDCLGGSNQPVSIGDVFFRRHVLTVFSVDCKY